MSTTEAHTPTPWIADNVNAPDDAELRRATTSGLHPYRVREVHEWTVAALKVTP